MRSCRRVALLMLPAAIVALIALTIHPQIAFATDCQEVTDCLANDLRGSMAALAAVALLVGLIVAPEIFVPFAIAKGVVEAITGKDVVTGQDLNWPERALGVLPVVGELGPELRVGQEVLSEVESVSAAEREATAVAEETAATAVPDKASKVLGEIDRRGAAPPGYKGGQQFANDGRQGGQVLQQADAAGNPITYREYDINQFQKGVNRGAERVVTGSDGSAYYTDDHYGSFRRIR